MFSSPEIMTWAACLLYLIGYVVYVINIARRKTEPALATWIIWAALDVIAVIGMYHADSLNGQIVGATIGSVVTVGFLLYYGTSGWTKLDVFCLAGAILGIVLWQTFDDPVLGIVTSQVVLLIGAIPTFKLAWDDPRRENKWAWSLWGLSSVPTFLVIPEWNLKYAAQPFIFLFIALLMLPLLFWPEEIVDES